jgi:hypothetical protein
VNTKDSNPERIRRDPEGACSHYTVTSFTFDCFDIIKTPPPIPVPVSNMLVRILS